MENIDFNKIIDDIEKFLIKKYGEDIEIEVEPENYKQYQEDFDKKLIKAEELQASFLTPNGQFKRLYFDLSDFNLDQNTKEILNIKDNNEIQNIIFIPNSFAQFYGFDINSLMKVGFTYITINPIENSVSFRYNSFYEEPSKKFEEAIEKLFDKYDVIYCDQYKPDQIGPSKNQVKFAKSEGAVSQQVTAWFNEIYQNNFYSESRK